MKSIFLLIVAALLLAGCAKPPEQVYSHPKTGQEFLAVHVNECSSIAEKFGLINMTPVHNYPMEDMKDHFQRVKIFEYCMRKKGYEQGDAIAIIIDETNTRIDISDTLLAVGDKAEVTISFSSRVGGLDAEDLTVDNGTLSGIRTADGGLTWTAQLTPLPDLEANDNVIRLNNAGVIDSVSNLGTGVTVSSSYAIDTLRPVVSIKIIEPLLGDAFGDYDGSNPDNSLVTFIFSEAPLNFVKNDIAVSHGEIRDLVRDDPTHYHATFIAAKDFVGKGSVTVDATKFSDLASNTNPAATPAFVSIDTQRPTITAALDHADGRLR